MSLKFTSKNTLKRIFTRLSEIFVKKSDIVDNLSSTDTTKPLSANQGKTLNDALTTLITDYEPLTEAECDAIIAGTLTATTSETGDEEEQTSDE